MAAPEPLRCGMKLPSLAEPPGDTVRTPNNINMKIVAKTIRTKRGGCCFNRRYISDIMFNEGSKQQECKGMGRRENPENRARKDQW